MSTASEDEGVFNKQIPSLNEIFAPHVDAFFVDRFDARYSEDQSSVIVVFEAEYFGQLEVLAVVAKPIEEVAAELACIASEVFERMMTECGTHGIFRAEARPVSIPPWVRHKFHPQPSTEH